MNYYELRNWVKTLVPRRTQLESLEKHHGLVKEKGRKVNYKEFKLDAGEMVPIQRLLNKEEINSFLEVSLRAAHCPMPLNADVWDGLRCGFGCKYCFADAFRSSLYTSFFDNGKTMGLRTCKPDYFRAELDKLMKLRGKRNTGSEVQRAIGLEIPIRLGIRFEDFLPIEGRTGVSLNFLQYLAEQEYPVMINTKSALIGREDYVQALADNKAGAAVHITMISSNDYINKKMEPGAPIFKERIQAAKALTDAGIRVVARIEPLMIFINDDVEDVIEWVYQVGNAGVRNITFDTYSWSATAPGIRRQIEREGFDFDRMFLLMSDSQWLGSLILGKFITDLKAQSWAQFKWNFSCSTFDFGNVPLNDQDICCEVGDVYKNFSYGNTVMAIRFIKERSYPIDDLGHRKGEAAIATWDAYDSYVEDHGGWLSEAMRRDVFNAWNMIGNPAYFPDWAIGMEPCGMDHQGRVAWKFNPFSDYRFDLFRGMINECSKG